jgi:alpha-1,6-mannosyltransferase
VGTPRPFVKQVNNPATEEERLFSRVPAGYSNTCGRKPQSFDVRPHGRIMQNDVFPSRALLIVAGSGLVCLHVWLAWMSAHFEPNILLLDRPVAAFVVLELAAGALFLAAAWVTKSVKYTRGMFVWLMVVGAIMRGSLAASTPVLETDFYRYLWDGAVAAHGINPYRYSPGQVTEVPDSVPHALRQLARESGEIVHRVNHEGLRTIYPPVSQAFFALAYVIKPWSLSALRLILVSFDVITCVLLLRVLRSLGLSPLLVLIYWWNPLVVKEIVNSAHMDVIALPLVVASVMLAARGRPVWAVVPLILATATKLWPAVLLPHILFPLRRSMPMLVAAVAIFVVSCGILFLPVFLAGIDSSSGFLAYSVGWEMNDGLYMALAWATQSFLAVLGQSSAWWAHAVPRVVVFIVLCAWIVWLLKNKPGFALQGSSVTSARDVSLVEAAIRERSENPDSGFHRNVGKHRHDTGTGLEFSGADGIWSPLELWQACLMVVAALFLLSPTQFPWYYLWVIPFLVMQPRPSLLLLSAILPLYYLRFHFKARHAAWIFDDYIVWLEYVPVWVLLLREWWTTRRPIRLEHPGISR